MNRKHTKEFMEAKAFLEEHGNSPEVVNKYICKQKGEGADLRRAISALQAYAYSLNDEDLVSEVALLITDGKYCSGLMNKISKITLKKYGKEIWKTIFGNMDMPEAGWTLNEMNEFTATIEQKFISVTSRDDYENTLKKGNPWVRRFKASERKELNLNDVDGIIAKMNADFLHTLNEFCDSGQLFFNQIIDDSVIKEYESGRWDIRREGTKIIFIKIPFLMTRYLNETDNQMKRFYACHCPWARKSIMTDQNISQSFCYCSFGHDKQGLEWAFGRELDGRVICSVLDGNSVQCMFEADIPDDIVNAS